MTLRECLRTGAVYDQMRVRATFTDHLGNSATVDGRNDIFAHRVIVLSRVGWVTRSSVHVTLWTVNDEPEGLFAVLGYQFHRQFSVYAGLNGNPGRASLQGSHPYWLGHDRVMADEFFRPYLRTGRGRGEVLPGLWYTGMLGNNNSGLGITAVQLDRRWRRRVDVVDADDRGVRTEGRFDDWEHHEELATRFGFAAWFEPGGSLQERRRLPSNTTLRLADSSICSTLGSLAPGVTVRRWATAPVGRCRPQVHRGFFVQRSSSSAGSTTSWPTARYPSSDSRQGLLRAGRVLSGPEEARDLRRDVVDLRRQGRGVQTSTSTSAA